MYQQGLYNKIIKIAVIVTILSFESNVVSQDKTHAENSVLRVTTNPTGAMVVLQGEYQFMGRTPFVIPYPIYGCYQVKVNKAGYEPITSEITFAGDAGNSLVMNLIPRTPLKAMYRSCAFPGWGQFYSGRKSMGALFAGITISTFIAMVQVQHQYLDAKNEYDLALERYRWPGSTFDEQVKNYDAVQKKKQNFKDHQLARDTCQYIAAGIWLLNVLESYLFFDDHASTIQLFQNLSTQVNSDGPSFSFNVHYPIR